MILEHAGEIFLHDNPKLRLFDCAHRSGAGGIVQQSQFTKIVPRSKGIHDEFLAIFVTAVHFDLARLDDKQRIRRVVLVNHNSVLGECSGSATTLERLQLFVRQAVKYFHLI